MLKPILFLIPLFAFVAALSGFWLSSPVARVSSSAAHDLTRAPSGSGTIDREFAARVRALPW